MTELTDRLASVSLPVIVGLLAFLTLVRGSLIAMRARPLRAPAELCESALVALVVVFLLLRPFVVQSFFIPSGSMHPTLWENDRILVNKFIYRTYPPRRGDVVVFRAPRTADAAEQDFIKRVVGVPGDVIEVREGFVIVGARERATVFTRDAILGGVCPDSCLSSSGDTPPLRLTTDALWLGLRRFTPEAFAAAVGRAGEPVTIQPGQVIRNNEVLTETCVSEDPQYHMNPVRVPLGALFVLGDNRNDSRDSHVWGTFPVERVIGRADAVFWPLSHWKRLVP